MWHIGGYFWAGPREVAAYVVMRNSWSCSMLQNQRRWLGRQSPTQLLDLFVLLPQFWRNRQVIGLHFIGISDGPFRGRLLQKSLDGERHVASLQRSVV